MKLPILFLMVCGIGFVLVAGCTNITSAPPVITPTTEQTPAPTSVPTTMPVSDNDTLCGELVYCGYAPAGPNPSNPSGATSCSP